MVFQDFLQYEILGNTVEAYGVSAAVFLGCLLVILALKYIVVPRLRRLAEKTETALDDVLIAAMEKNAIPAFVVAALYISTKSLALNASLRKVIYTSTAVMVAFFAVRFILTPFRFGLEKQWVRAGADSTQRRSLKVMQTGIQTLIWVIALIVLLDNLGIKISTLVAGLGIGGIAVALAAQAILGDLFAYFMILIDHPFESGDFIIVDDYMGAIEHIGLKSTRIRSLGGELLVFRNTDLTGSRIRNYKKMEQRRVVFTLGVTYGTGIEQGKKIPGIIASIIGSLPNARFDRAHFKEFGDFSLVYEVVYYVLSADYNLYMDIQQEINFKIREEFKKLGAEFAFPTSTVYLEHAIQGA